MLYLTTIQVNPLWLIFGGIIIAVGAILIFNFVKRDKTSPPPTPKLQPDHPKPEPPRQKTESEPVLSSEDEKIIKEIKPMIKHLTGSMNALQGIIQGEDTDSADIVFINISQIIKAHGSEMLKSWFSSFAGDRNEWDTTLYKDKAKKMFQILEWCGVTKFDETKFEWNDISKLRYRRLSKIEAGQTFEVLAPCWYYDGLIFEQGIIRAVN